MTATRLDVSTWEHLGVETRGAAQKEWLADPANARSDPDAHWLFKPAYVHRNGDRQCGDWTECVASALAARLGVPAAQTLLAVRDGTEGVLIRNVRPAEYDMQTGRLAMLDQISIEPRDSRRDMSASPGHSLDNIRLTLEPYAAPPRAETWGGCTAFDVFVGYLVLDAVIGNVDRHEQNWSVLRARSSAGPPDAVAPAYDMETSLGFQLRDSSRQAKLNSRGQLDAFARKGLAQRFDGDRTTSLVDLASKAASICTDRGIGRVREIVEALQHVDLGAIVSPIGGVSEVTSTFAIEVMKINVRRIGDAFRA